VNTLAVVILSLFLGIFIASLIALCGFLVYQQHKLSATITTLSTTFPALISSLAAQISRIRGDELERFAVMGMEAAKSIASSASRVERGAVAVGELCTHLLSEDALQSSGLAGAVGTARNKLGPEEYAPDDGSPYVSTSRLSQQDQLAMRTQYGDKPNPITGPHGVPNIYSTTLNDLIDAAEAGADNDRLETSGDE
jgi:hypothetical protein